MFNIVLFEPEIPPNTGNIIRLAANTGCQVHLVEPLGFSLDDKKMRRAGLDYHALSALHVHSDWASFLQHCPAGSRFFACSTRASVPHTTPRYEAGDYLVFGPETRGLPQALLDDPLFHARLRLPMRADSRSLNLSNAVAVVVYEAWRQLGFAGAV